MESNQSWTQLGSDIDGEAAGDRSGYSVSLDSDGDRVAIGADLNDGAGSNAGHVRIYEYRYSSSTDSDGDGWPDTDTTMVTVFDTTQIKDISRTVSTLSDKLYQVQIGYVDVHPNGRGSVTFNYTDGTTDIYEFYGNGSVTYTQTPSSGSVSYTHLRAHET